MSHCYLFSKPDSTGHRPNHKRSARRQATNRRSQMSGSGVKNDQHPDGGEWRIGYQPASVAHRNRDREHSNLKNPTEFCDNFLAI